jgi:ribosomal protein L39E
MGIKNHQRKLKLGKANRQTKWAPIWVVLKKFGIGKKVHPSQTTRVKRNWRRTKLRIKPRLARPNHFG